MTAKGSSEITAPNKMSVGAKRRSRARLRNIRRIHPTESPAANAVNPTINSVSGMRALLSQRARSCMSSAGGSGKAGVSPSHAIDTIHQRVPSVDS